MRVVCLRHVLLITVLLGSISAADAEIYIYKGPDGERMISDRVMPGYTLISKRDSLRNAGHILANRPIATGGPRRFQPYIINASDRYGVDPALIEAVIQVESGFNPEAVSKKGATGLMQLMSATAQQYQVKDRTDPRENINAGVQHLSKLMNQFNGELPLAVAAYNAGASAVVKYAGIPPYPETQRYVTKVMSYHSEYRQLRYGAY